MEDSISVSFFIIIIICEFLYEGQKTWNIIH